MIQRASYAEERLYFADALGRGGDAYVMSFAYRLTGTLDLAALRRAFLALCEQRAELRAGFRVEDGKVGRFVAEPRAEVWRELRLDDDQLAELPAHVRAAAAVSFELERPPLLRASALACGDEHVLVLSLHHILADGWAMNLILADLAALYAAERAGRPLLLAPRPSPAGYAERERARLAGDEFAELFGYWRAQLAGAPDALPLPTDRPYPATPPPAGRAAIAIPAAARARLRALARAERASEFMLLLALYAALLRDVSGERAIVVASPAAGRYDAADHEVIGLCANIVPLCLRVEPATSLRELLRATREVVLDGIDHQALPFQALIEGLKPERVPGRGPLAQVAISYGAVQAPQLSLEGVVVTPLESGAEKAKFDLTLLVGDGEADGAELVYAGEVFEPATVRGWAERFARLLERALDDPDAPLAALGTGEAGAPAAGPPPLTELPSLAHALERTHAAPAATAVAGDQPWSYDELRGHARRLTHYLRDNADLSGTLALMLERSAPLAAALCAGLACAPRVLLLEPSPQHAALLERYEVSCVLVADDAGWLPATSAQVIALALEDDLIRTASDAAPEIVPAALLVPAVGADGAPTALEFRAEALAGAAAWFSQQLRERGVARYAQLCPLDAPSFSWELLGALHAGAALRFVPDDAGRSRAGLRAAAADADAALLPYGTLAAAGGYAPELVPPTAFVLDAPAELAGAAGVVGSAGSASVIALAGHDACAGLASADGRPVPGAVAAVLDDDGRAVAAGTVGTLYLTAAHLAERYLDPAAHARAFPAGELAGAPGRVLRTELRGAQRADGSLWIAPAAERARYDGARALSLLRLEALLRAHPQVADAYAGAASGVVFVSAPGAADALPGLLRAHLRAQLREADLPTEIVVLDALPRGAGGALDRRALTALAAGRQPRGAVDGPALSADERLVAELWAETLERDDVAAEVNFFDAGGHSLAAIRVIATIRRRHGVDMGIGDLVDHPTLREFATAFAAARARRETPA